MFEYQNLNLGYMYFFFLNVIVDHAFLECFKHIKTFLKHGEFS
jgi:hypothetical protein